MSCFRVEALERPVIRYASSNFQHTYAAAALAYSVLIAMFVMSWHTPPSTFTKLSTFDMLTLMPCENSESWLLIYSRKVLLFHRPIFIIALSE